MAEIFFVLITIYVVYVINNVINSNQKNKPEKIDSEPETVKPEQASVAQAEVVVTKTENKAAEKKPAVKKAPVKKVVAKKASTTQAKATSSAKPKAKSAAKAKPAAKTKESLPNGSIRNPETGEVAKIASQYRMTKRWIKEALVSEGLLDKIYKTSELDDKAKVKIDKALKKLASMEKYQ